MKYILMLIGCAFVSLWMPIGCASHDVNGDKLNCKANPTDMRCAPKRVQSTKGMVQICEGRSRSDMRCTWIRRDELDRILREAQR